MQLLLKSKNFKDTVHAVVSQNIESTLTLNSQTRSQRPTCEVENLADQD